MYFLNSELDRRNKEYTEKHKIPCCTTQKEMEYKKSFKGFALDANDHVLGAFPSVDVIQEQKELAIRKMSADINQQVIEYCLRINIDPDVLLKQKAEIERLQMQIDKMKRCENCRNLRFVQIKQNKIISHCVLEKDIYSSKPKSGICNNYDKWELAEDMTVEVCCSATN